MAARPEPAPTSSTRPDPDVRNRSVGSRMGPLSIAFRTTTAAPAHTVMSASGIDTQLDHDRQNAMAARPPARMNGTSIA